MQKTAFFKLKVKIIQHATRYMLLSRSNIIT